MRKGLVLGLAGLFLLSGCGKKVTCSQTLKEGGEEIEAKVIASVKKDKIDSIEVVYNTEKKDTDITQFISNVKKYTEITELLLEILNELIERIVIHQTEKIDGKKTQEIDIYYRGVGIISFPVSMNDIEITINKIFNRRKA